MKKITIGGGQGFWGDSPDAAIHMINNADLDYMACDYLAELTLSILQRQKMKNPQAGFARDFVGLMGEIMTAAKSKHTRVLTDAGGMNVEGLVNALSEMAGGKGLNGYKIGYVLGDDLLPRVDDLEASGVTFENMDGGGDYADIKGKILYANVYYGHEPIRECLENGADAVITGRATDSALFLAPLAHSFGWQNDEWDNLARGIMTGHLLECGGQGAGGNFEYGWRDVPRMDELGFPIAELTDNGLTITKAPDCGGLISEQSVKEQFLYEVHDPANYITPDVTVDLSHASLTQQGDNRVDVAGIKGKPRTGTLKLCIGYSAGYRTVSYLSFAWPDAYEKAQYAAQILMKKMKRKGLSARDVHVSYMGLNALHLGLADMSRAKDANEVILRIAVHADTKAEAEKIVPEIAPLQLNGPPGASFFGGRAKATEVIGLFPTLIPRDAVKLTSHIKEVKR
jgi:hypothetical protein